MTYFMFFFVKKSCGLHLKLIQSNLEPRRDIRSENGGIVGRNSIERRQRISLFLLHYINIVILKSARMTMNKMLLGYCILLLETVPRRLSNFPT